MTDHPKEREEIARRLFEAFYQVTTDKPLLPWQLESWLRVADEARRIHASEALVQQIAQLRRLYMHQQAFERNGRDPLHSITSRDIGRVIERLEMLTLPAAPGE